MFSKKMILVFLLIPVFCFSQVLRVKTTIDADHLAFEDQQELKDLPEKIEEYLNNYQWTEDEYETDVIANIYIIIESVRKKSHEKIYKAQFQIKSESGESFYDTYLEFPYYRGYPLEHNKVQFDPLTHFLDYYAFLILAGELDTYGLLLGTPFYDKALDLANQGGMSQYPKGWAIRIKELEKITHVRTRPIRESKPDFFEAEYYLSEGDLKNAKFFGDKVMTKIEMVYKDQPNNKYMKLFFEAHYRTFAQIYKNDPSTLEKLILFDPGNKEHYRQFQNN